MSNEDYVLGTREPSGGDRVQGNNRMKREIYPLPVVRENGVGKSENEYARMERMYYKEKGDIVVSAHPEEDVNASRED